MAFAAVAAAPFSAGDDGPTTVAVSRLQPTAAAGAAGVPNTVADDPVVDDTGVEEVSRFRCASTASS